MIICFIDFLFLVLDQLKAFVHWIGIQGALVGFLPLLASGGHANFLLYLIAGLSVIIRAYIFPYFLMRAVQGIHFQRETRSVLLIFVSLLAGIIVWAFSLDFAWHLPQKDLLLPSLSLSVGFFTIAIGLILLMTRRTALLQVVGYLNLENGIYVLGISLDMREPFLVEIGMLLDLFVAIFIMGILIFHIHQNFENMDTDQLSILKDKIQ
jgi:hydrogenase-4 component E